MSWSLTLPTALNVTDFYKKDTNKDKQMCLQFELTESLGVDVLVLELVVGGVGVDHDPLHAVATELLLGFKEHCQAGSRQRLYKHTHTHSKSPVPD